MMHIDKWIVIIKCDLVMLYFLEKNNLGTTILVRFDFSLFLGDYYESSSKKNSFVYKSYCYYMLLLYIYQLEIIPPFVFLLPFGLKELVARCSSTLSSICRLNCCLGRTGPAGPAIAGWMVGSP